MGAGFQYTPFGMLPLDQAVPTSTTEHPGAVLEVHRDAPTAEGDSHPVKQAEPVKRAEKRAPAIASAPLTPGALVKQARARVREIKAELRRMRALEKELAELERLIRAAKQRPQSNVRALRSAG